jgi:hypothetical protein
VKPLAFSTIVYTVVLSYVPIKNHASVVVPQVGVLSLCYSIRIDVRIDSV